jgi:hypothetical protein
MSNANNEMTYAFNMEAENYPESYVFAYKHMFVATHTTRYRIDATTEVTNVCKLIYSLLRSVFFVP